MLEFALLKIIEMIKRTFDQLKFMESFRIRNRLILKLFFVVDKAENGFHDSNVRPEYFEDLDDLINCIGKQYRTQ